MEGVVNSMQSRAALTGQSGSTASSSDELVRAASSIKAQVHRRLLAKRDEAILEARNASMPAKTIEAAKETKQMDNLLPLWTKGEFARDLPLLMAKAGTGAPLSLLFIDLDHFKNVN